jgi:hypothetical protein
MTLLNITALLVMVWLFTLTVYLRSILTSQKQRSRS